MRVSSKGISSIFLFPETDYFAQSCFSTCRCQMWSSLHDGRRGGGGGGGVEFVDGG